MTVRVGASGVEISRIASATAMVAIGAATRANQDKPINQTNLATNLAEGIEASLNRVESRGNNRNLLWIDDMPSNNDYLVNAFRDIGINVFLAYSTEEAKNKLSEHKYDLIITDMSRPPDSEAGLTFLRYLETQKFSTPAIIYASYWVAAHIGQEDNFGVTLITNDPSKVYSAVLRRMLSSS